MNRQLNTIKIHKNGEPGTTDPGIVVMRKADFEAAIMEAAIKAAEMTADKLQKSERVELLRFPDLQRKLGKDKLYDGELKRRPMSQGALKKILIEHDIRPDTNGYYNWTKIAHYFN